MSDGADRLRYGRSGHIAWLVPGERLARDDDQRQRLMTLLGEGGPSMALARAREELAYRMARAAHAIADCDFDEVREAARQVRRIGLHLGFPALAQAADNVIDCLERADAAALSATVARLHRLGGMALDDLSR